MPRRANEDALAHLMNAVMGFPGVRPILFRAFAYLERADLTYADLSHATLVSCDLADAVLRECDVHRASLIGAVLDGADRAGMTGTDPDRARAEDFRAGR